MSITKYTENYRICEMPGLPLTGYGFCTHIFNNKWNLKIAKEKTLRQR